MRSVGIDVGATQLRAAIFDESHTMQAVYKTPNDQARSCRENMDDLLAFVQTEQRESSDPICGIGIGCPGPLDIPGGKVLNPPNIPGWWNFDIVDYVEEKTGLPAKVNNDANVAGLAEALLGAGKGYESVAFIGLSTGFGGAYVYRGELVNGAHSLAAEWWNMMVNDDQYHHGSALPGTLNEQACGGGMQHAASEAYGRDVDAKELFNLWHAGDETAAKLVDRAADVGAKGIANLVCTIDPDVFIIGGSIAIYNPDYVELLYQKTKGYSLAPDALVFLPAQFGDDAGLLGASLLVQA